MSMQAWARGLMGAQRSEVLRKFIYKPKKKKLPTGGRWKQISLIESLIRRGGDGFPVKSRNVCPECHRRMNRLNIGEYVVSGCHRCRSLWIGSQALKKISKEAKGIPGDHLRSRASRYKCPSCQALMREYVYKHPKNLLVDRCDDGCHGVYFENGEIRRALEMVNR